MQIRIAGLQNILAICKFAQNGVFFGKLRCQVVRGTHIGVDDFPVALLASRVSQKVMARGCSYFVGGCFSVAGRESFSLPVARHELRLQQ